MKYCLIFIIFFSFFSYASTSQAGAKNTMLKNNQASEKLVFTQANSDEMLQFEKDIAFFYGAKESQRIADHYIHAIQAFEKIGLQATEETLKDAMINPLQKAYEEVQKQTSYKFDVNKAALYEFQLILAQAKQESFESIYDIMIRLYYEVFQSNSVAIHKAAMLRTFLYKYKINNLKQEHTLSDQDRSIMRAIAKESESQLLQSKLNKGI